ncbi:trypsin-like peptidase domain-containing protein [uncultured Cocleimonas sp.]|uniref:trypsin-like peptidase domain-containing protein n=1 Tax=uncultured Cocleimonas sp. TaxID=1051587 RepID=UPI0026115814|nr:trypsin-like peptidase domain-containing protein [uncultured Cocleimonas sp.]
MNTANAKLPVAVNGQPLPSLADMLERITPAVVNISTENTSSGTPVKDPVYRHFFGKNVPTQPGKPIGTGSGIVIDAQNGYVVTNAHVIENANKIIVTLKDKRQFYAKIIGKDLKADVAVIQIQPDRLTAMVVASGKPSRVGDFVVAIGNPYGLGQSVTSGIVSALGRTGLGIEDYEDFIQTDAPINPGNSGGALVNLRGELIGINTAILGGKSGGNVGIGFAIPADMIINITDQLVQNGRVERGQLGIEIQDIRPALVKAFNLPDGQGALISGVVSLSPADKAGIKEGDIITRINGATVTNSSNLKSMIGNLRMGSKVQMEYVRNGLIKKCVAEVGQVSAGMYREIDRQPAIVSEPEVEKDDPWGSFEVDN